MSHCLDCLSTLSYVLLFHVILLSTQFFVPSATLWAYDFFQLRWGSWNEKRIEKLRVFNRRWNVTIVSWWDYNLRWQRLYLVMRMRNRNCTPKWDFIYDRQIHCYDVVLSQPVDCCITSTGCLLSRLLKCFEPVLSSLSVFLLCCWHFINEQLLQMLCVKNYIYYLSFSVGRIRVLSEEFKYFTAVHLHAAGWYETPIWCLRAWYVFSHVQVGTKLVMFSLLHWACGIELMMLGCWYWHQL